MSINLNPKTVIAVKWSDFKTSKDLTSFIEDQAQDEFYITKAWLADTLEMLNDMGEDEKMITELADVAKVMTTKKIQIILL